MHLQARTCALASHPGALARLTHAVPQGDEKILPESRLAQARGQAVHWAEDLRTPAASEDLRAPLQVLVQAATVAQGGVALLWCGVASSPWVAGAPSLDASRTARVRLLRHRI